MQTKLGYKASESVRFKLPMQQLTIEGIKVHRIGYSTIFDGRKNFDGYHEQVKKIVLDALTTKTNWSDV